MSSSGPWKVEAYFEAAASFMKYSGSCSSAIKLNKVSLSMKPKAMEDVKCCTSTQYLSCMGKTDLVLVVDTVMFAARVALHRR